MSYSQLYAHFPTARPITVSGPQQLTKKETEALGDRSDTAEAVLAQMQKLTQSILERRDHSDSISQRKAVQTEWSTVRATLSNDRKQAKGSRKRRLGRVLQKMEVEAFRQAALSHAGLTAQYGQSVVDQSAHVSAAGIQQLREASRALKAERRLIKRKFSSKDPEAQQMRRRLGEVLTRVEWELQGTVSKVRGQPVTRVGDELYRDLARLRPKSSGKQATSFTPLQLEIHNVQEKLRGVTSDQRLSPVIADMERRIEKLEGSGQGLSRRDRAALREMKKLIKPYKTKAVIADMAQAAQNADGSVHNKLVVAQADELTTRAWFDQDPGPADEETLTEIRGKIQVAREEAVFHLEHMRLNQGLLSRTLPKSLCQSITRDLERRLTQLDDLSERVEAMVYAPGDPIRQGVTDVAKNLHTPMNRLMRQLKQHADKETRDLAMHLGPHWHQRLMAMQISPEGLARELDSLARLVKTSKITDAGLTDSKVGKAQQELLDEIQAARKDLSQLQTLQERVDEIEFAVVDMRQFASALATRDSYDALFPVKIREGAKVSEEEEAQILRNTFTLEAERMRGRIAKQRKVIKALGGGAAHKDLLARLKQADEIVEANLRVAVQGKRPKSILTSQERRLIRQIQEGKGKGYERLLRRKPDAKLYAQLVQLREQISLDVLRDPRLLSSALDPLDQLIRHLYRDQREWSQEKEALTPGMQDRHRVFSGNAASQMLRDVRYMRPSSLKAAFETVVVDAEKEKNMHRTMPSLRQRQESRIAMAAAVKGALEQRDLIKQFGEGLSFLKSSMRSNYEAAARGNVENNWRRLSDISREVCRERYGKRMEDVGFTPS